MSENPYLPSGAEQKQPQKRRRFWMYWLETLCAIAILGILVGLFLPADRRVPNAWRRTACANNLRQIGIALNLYRDMHGRFPPAFTVDDQGNPLHSWRTLILPFLDEYDRYDSIDFSKPWDHPLNQHALNAETPNLYRCPSTNLPDGHTNYVSLLDATSVIRKKQSVSLDEVLDNQGKTLLVIELPQSHSVHWMSPEDSDLESFLSATTVAKPAHPSGYNAVFCDNQILFLPKEQITEEILGAMISCAGKDDGLITDDW
jgi:type II secretory pathway pseudopilin PulG